MFLIPLKLCTLTFGPLPLSVIVVLSITLCFLINIHIFFGYIPSTVKVIRLKNICTFLTMCRHNSIALSNHCNATMVESMITVRSKTIWHQLGQVCDSHVPTHLNKMVKPNASYVPSTTWSAHSCFRHLFHLSFGWRRLIHQLIFSTYSHRRQLTTTYRPLACSKWCPTINTCERLDAFAILTCYQHQCTSSLSAPHRVCSSDIQQIIAATGVWICTLDTSYPPATPCSLRRYFYSLNIMLKRQLLLLPWSFLLHQFLAKHNSHTFLLHLFKFQLHLLFILKILIPWLLEVKAA